MYRIRLSLLYGMAKRSRTTTKHMRKLFSLLRSEENQYLGKDSRGQVSSLPSVRATGGGAL